jgi:hypothetical protein
LTNASVSRTESAREITSRARVTLGAASGASSVRACSHVQSAGREVGAHFLRGQLRAAA